MKPSDALLMSESARPRYDNPPRVNQDTLCLGDAQIPFHDAAFINKVKRVALAWGVKHLTLGGDIYDLHALAKWVGVDDTRLNQEVRECNLFSKELISGFEQADLVRGNHESRISNALGQYLDTENLVRLLGLPEWVRASDYYWLEVGDNWLIEHPVNASVIPARIASWLAEKYRRNVATFHGHTTGSAQTRDGGLIGVDVGICCDPFKLAYTSIRHNVRPAMTQGALLLIKTNGNKFHHYHLTAHTDFEAMAELGGMWQKQKMSSQNQNDFWRQVSLAHSRLMPEAKADRPSKNFLQSVE